MSEAYDDAAERSVIWKDGYSQGQEDLLNEMLESTPITADEWLKEIMRVADSKSIDLKAVEKR